MRDRENEPEAAETPEADKPPEQSAAPESAPPVSDVDVDTAASTGDAGDAATGPAPAPSPEAAAEGGAPAGADSPALPAALDGEVFADHEFAVPASEAAATGDAPADPSAVAAPSGPGDPAAPPKEPGDAEATAPETALVETPVESVEDSPPDPPPAPGEPAHADDRASESETPAVSIVEVRDLDWDAIRAAVANPISGERAESILSRMEEKLADGGPVGLAFEEFASSQDDQAIQVGEEWPLGDVWFVGDLHGDLLALEAALQHVERGGGATGARIVFLGDLFDDGAHAAEVVLRVFELVLDGPMRATVVAGNHDEALARKGGRFQSTVLPSDFTDWLNAQAEAGHPWAERLGRVIIRFFRRTPRALFFPDGLLVAHGGIPHTDLHPVLEAEGNWNDPRVLQDFVWLRAHPRARKRIPNRTTRGSEFGREDFAAFCDVATRMGRPVSRMLRGHDHVEERYAVFPRWSEHPALTINTLSHKLPREVFGPYERVPVIARWVRGRLPEVRRLFVPPELLREIYPEPAAPGAAAEAAG